MHRVSPKSTNCPITDRLDKVRKPERPLYTSTPNSLLLYLVSHALLDKCYDCPFGVKREITINGGMAEIKCGKWGNISES